MKKKIAIVRSTYSPFGGVERVALSLVEGLLQKGLAVTLLTFPGQSWPIDDPNLQLVPLGLFRTHRLIQAWSFETAVRRYLRRHDFDCIFSLDKVTCFTHLHAGGGTHKTFLRIRAGYSNRLSRFFRRLSLYHRYILHLEKKGFENPRLQKVRCNAGMVKRDIQADYGVPEERLSVIHSGIRWKSMEPVFDDRVAVAEDLRRQHDLSPDWACLLFLGSGFDRKGLDIAIQGLAAMPPVCHLLVVGKGATGPYERLAETLNLTGRVHFLGSQPQGWRYATCCRALVLPSRYDPFGGAAAEGHAMGIPVLVSDTTGFADYVVPGENGIILNNPMTAQTIQRGFVALWELIRHPRQTPAELHAHVRCLDDDAILERLLAEFLSL
ncbi:putative Glycosyl transferase [Desulfosarcina cetonica]|uniref:glycosyltransferase family 4 protein n=1 Tax=Desulfosarcina cetonica TaxID=90730 RepID=UPI0006D22413|nr:glycosyltransferase family 4 protein [Desulfosarcina cetonica]VTR70645.1 putative Glycosyl transferase [Desulfosarcina cetonica]